MTRTLMLNNTPAVGGAIANRGGTVTLKPLDPGLLGQEARTLSGGELQRMCLARTLVTQPETLLLDEPTSALDARPKRVFESTAQALAGQGITIVWVTHDDAQAGQVADRVFQRGIAALPAYRVRPAACVLHGTDARLTPPVIPLFTDACGMSLVKRRRRPVYDSGNSPACAIRRGVR